MAARLLTDLSPPPPGFSPTSFTKRDMLRDNVALLVRSFEDFESAVAPFRHRLRGCVITTGEGLNLKRLGPLLWHLQVTEDALPGLSSLVRGLMELFSDGEAAHEQCQLQDSSLSRLKADLDATRQDYDHATERILERMAQISKLNQELEARIQRQLLTKRSLRESQERLRTILDSIQDAVIATDGQLRVIRMNPAAVALTGWDTEDAGGRPFTHVVRLVDAESRQPIAAPVETPAAHTILIDRQGVEHRVANSGAPIRNGDGELLGYVLVFRDVTEQHRLEQRVQQTQKIEAIGHLAGGVAHDFNNMLGGIMSAAEMANVYLDDTPEARRFVQMILETSENAAGLVGKLLAFSRKAPRITTVFEVHKVIEDALSILDRSIDRRIQTQRVFADELLQLQGDPSQIQSALLNLCINARDAMESGGTLTVGTEKLQIEEPHDLDVEPGTYVHVFVRDTGIGISPEVRHKMFEPFYTTKELGRGTGLGLAAVHNAVTEHQGSIRVESEPGRGATFHVYLPFVLPQPPPPQKTNDETHQGSGLILLIDDEEIIREIGANILEDLGYRVLTAEDGERGLLLFREHREQVALVILDMIMPKMNGEDCFMAIRRESPDARVLLCSGYTSKETIERLKGLGLAGFLSKPFRKQGLLEAIEAALEA